MIATLRQLNRASLICCVLVAWQLHQMAFRCGAQQPESRQQETPLVDFVKDVAPILDQHCIHCHGASKQSADLRLDLRAAILKGSGSGPVLKVGDSSDSRLIEVVSGADQDLVMPPEGEQLNRQQVDLLRAWIDQGAQGPDDARELEKPLPWSFRPIVHREVFNASKAIDGWLSSRLEQHQLQFSEPENPATLVRRLYLVALGVPPTIDELQQFTNLQDSASYERMVDRLLADPRYGERMARHWFDVVRFAESNGFETNRVRYDAWPYRDYVINAFNSDKPYDRFVAEQIAGDAVGADAATGFLVAGAFDLVKSPDVNLTLMQRQDELSDLVNTVGTTFMGLTIGCARCHDHKFDPVTQTDFYALQAIFAGVNFGQRKLPVDNTAETQQQMLLVRQKLAEATAEIQRFRQLAETSPLSTHLRPPVNAKLNEERFAAVRASSVRFTIFRSGQSQPCIDEWEVLDSQGNNVALASLGSVAKASSTLPGYAIHQLEHINDGKSGNEYSWISSEVDGGTIQIDFAAPATIVAMHWGRDRNGRFADRVASEYRIEARDEHDEWREIASSRDRRPLGQSDHAWIAELLDAETRKEFERALSQEKMHKDRLASLESGVSAWLGTFTQPPPVHRLYRGDPLMPRENIDPALVASLAECLSANGIDVKPLTADSSEQSRRLALVNWLIAPGNPLTARVMVNRLWHYTFGCGIVDTPSDFGANGSTPVHPELLDWLAYEFIQNGWSIKQIHRTLFLSRAFRQSSAPDASGLSFDAEARLLWRFPPRRLEAEAIRDSILVASGNINWEMGGAGFFLQRVEQDNVYRYFPKEQCGPAEYRRMVYLTRIRNEQDPVFGSFDCPSGNQVLPKRTRSNTALQALNLLNSTFVQDQAKFLAERLQTEVGQDASLQVERAFLILLGRAADAYEREIAVQLISEHGLIAFCRAMFNSTEFLFIF
jgi:Protein of unknown function (DUF1553)/Protein of unknown function (DUF1549)/Planctomycete cytochrome C